MNVSSMKQGVAQEGSHSTIEETPGEATLIPSENGAAKFAQDYPGFYDAMISGRVPKAPADFDFDLLVFRVRDSSSFFWWHVTDVFAKGNVLSLKYTGENQPVVGGECGVDLDVIPIFMVLAVEKPADIPTDLVSFNNAYRDMQCKLGLETKQNDPVTITLYS